MLRLGKYTVICEKVNVLLNDYNQNSSQDVKII